MKYTSKRHTSAKCGAKLLLFREITKYFVYFCRKYSRHEQKRLSQDAEKACKHSSYGLHRSRRTALYRKFCTASKKQYPAVRWSTMRSGRNCRICVVD